MSERKTEFSPCRRYRYCLWREWTIEELTGFECSAETEAHRYLMVIGLNPSTADETRDDATIRKCIGFAKRWGFGALCMTNLFAWRDTKPENMKAAAEPIGPDNDAFLGRLASNAGLILAAWGNHGSHLNRAKIVVGAIPRLQCLRRNKDGSPMHPLYVPYETQPIPYAP